MLFSKKERLFRGAYSDYYPIIFNTLYLRLRNRDDAEDICHDVFVDLYNKFVEVEDVRKWLFGAVRFALSNHYRKKGIAKAVDEDIEVIQNDIKFSFENGMKDLRIVLEEAIRHEGNYADEKERILFDLIAINKFTHAEAGEQLGLSKRQVEYKFNQASKRILEYLKAKGISRVEDLI